MENYEGYFYSCSLIKMQAFHFPIKCDCYKLAKLRLTIIVFAVGFFSLLIVNVWAASSILQASDQLYYPGLTDITENMLSDLKEMSQSNDISDLDRHFYAQQYKYEFLLFNYKIPLGSWQAKLLKIGFDESESGENIISFNKCLEVVKSGDYKEALNCFLFYYENCRNLSMISNDVELYGICNKYSIVPDDDSWRFQLAKKYVLAKQTLYESDNISSDRNIKEKEEELCQLEYRIKNNVKEPDFLSVYTLSKQVPTKLITCVFISVFFLICLTVERINKTDFRIAASPYSLRQWFVSKYVICFCAGIIFIIFSFIALIFSGIICFGASGFTGINLIGKMGKYVCLPTTIFVFFDLLSMILPLMLVMLITGALFAFFRTPVVSFPLAILLTLAMHFLIYMQSDTSLKILVCFVITVISLTIIEFFEVRREVAADDW